MTDLALIAGRGRLPVLVAEAAIAKVTVPRGTACDVPGAHPEFRLERLASIMEGWRETGIRRVCLAGGVDRPVIEPSRIEPASLPMVQRIAATLTGGDGGALAALLSILEEGGFEIVAPQEIRPDLLPEAGVLTGAPSERDRLDAERAAEILRLTGPLDIGQGCVVAQGLCLAVEAHPGTDHMLASLAGDLAGRRPDPSAGAGVMLKAPKPGQDRRVDLPTVGPATIDGAARAGLAGIAVEAGGVLMPDAADSVARAERHGLFLWARG